MAETVPPEEARKLIASNEADVIDLRDPDEFGKARIAGSRRVGDEDLSSVVEEGDSDRKIILVCGDGKQSGDAAEELDAGDREVLVLEGGIENWIDEGLLVQPSVDLKEGPAEIEEGDEEMAAEIEQGTLEPGQDPEEVGQQEDAKDQSEDEDDDSGDEAGSGVSEDPGADSPEGSEEGGSSGEQPAGRSGSSS